VKVDKPCHCFGRRRPRHRKSPVPVKVRISTCAIYNLPPSFTLAIWVGRGHRSGKLAFLINYDSSTTI
jgi:hypothetical protein